MIDERDRRTQNDAQFDRIRKEIVAYDTLARQKVDKGIESTTDVLVGRDLVRLYQSSGTVEGFPHPPSIWLDSLANPVSQLEAYCWLRPIEDRLFLQLGGSGSHALKALIGGASKAMLLTPMADEGVLCMQMADHLGLSSGLGVVQAIGEQIPIEDSSVDRIFGGGTLHHVDLAQGLSEISRVLKPGGRAAFVDPSLNFIYRFLELTGVRNLAREPGAQCYPLKMSDVLRHATGFEIAKGVLSGGPLRYAIVGLTRVFRLRIPLGLSLSVQQVETGLLNRLGLRSMLGGLAILLEK